MRRVVYRTWYFVYHFIIIFAYIHCLRIIATLYSQSSILFYIVLEYGENYNFRRAYSCSVCLILLFVVQICVDCYMSRSNTRYTLVDCQHLFIIQKIREISRKFRPFISCKSIHHKMYCIVYNTNSFQNLAPFHQTYPLKRLSIELFILDLILAYACSFYIRTYTHVII